MEDTDDFNSSYKECVGQETGRNRLKVAMIGNITLRCKFQFFCEIVKDFQETTMIEA